jgi:hybrid cluster-associated redox disulfide protein
MVTKDMLIGEIIQMNEKYPEILLEAGMHCLGCPASAGESLEEACAVHGINLDELVEK